jgi:hypothetical protein
MVANIKKNRLELWNIIIKNQPSAENKYFEGNTEDRGNVKSPEVKWLGHVENNKRGLKVKRWIQ